MSDNLVTWINQELEKRAWSIRELARRMNLSPSYVTKIVNGDTTPSANACILLSDVFNVPPEEVFRRAELLPAYPEKVSPLAFIREVTDILRDMTLEERQEVYDMAKYFYRKSREKRRNITRDQ